MVNGAADLVTGASRMVNGARSMGVSSPDGARLGADFTIHVTNLVQMVPRDITPSLASQGRRAPSLKRTSGLRQRRARRVTVYPNGTGLKNRPASSSLPGRTAPCA